MFYKVTNPDELHHGLQYQDGLNIDPKPFVDDDSHKGGLFFTNEVGLGYYLTVGKWLREVTLP